MDDWADKVAEVFGWSDLELVMLLDKSRLEFFPSGLWNIRTRGGAAFLTLEFKGTTDGIDDCVLDVGGLVDEVVVFAPSLTNYAGIASIFASSDVLTNFSIQLAEYSSAAGIVQGSKFLVSQSDLGNHLGVSWDELDDILGQAGFLKDLLDEIASIDGMGRWLPQDNISHQGRSSSKISTNGSEVEGRDGVYETFQRSVFAAVPYTGSMVFWLLGVELFSILDVESQEISQLSSGVNLSLPCVLALAEHGGSHDFIAVFCGDQVSSLEEDGGTVNKGERFPA